MVDKEYVFRSERSTLTNLAVLKQSILDSFESNSQLDFVNIGFEKAFGKINHIVLIRKLETVGNLNPLFS